MLNPRMCVVLATCCGAKESRQRVQPALCFAGRGHATQREPAWRRQSCRLSYSGRRPSRQLPTAAVQGLNGRRSGGMGGRALRNFFAVSLRNQLGLKEDELIACSMERREGAEYDFNEPLLEHALQQAKGEAIILMLFLLPGRHAGGEGDVATIAKEHAPDGLRWKLSPLLGTHPALPALLSRRHLPSPNFKTTKIAAISALLATGLLPVLGSIPAPKDQGAGASLMIWLGAFAVIFTVLFLFLRAKAWKKS